MLICEAVHTLALRGMSATVNAVADEIGIDHSGASRLINGAAGCLTMAPSAADGRRREASLTPAGRSMLEHAHRWQEGVFAALTSSWSEDKRRDFERSMTDVLQNSDALAGRRQTP